MAALHAIKMKETAMKIEAGVQEVLTYMAFSFEHRTRIHASNVIERLKWEIRHRDRVMGRFPGGNSVPMLACARHPAQQ